MTTTTDKLRQLKNNLPRNMVENPRKDLSNPEETIQEAIDKIEKLES